LGLTPVRVELWGGWVWFNMNPQARSLREFLGEMAMHLEPYEFEKWDIVDYRTIEIACNWKHTVDSANESYHFLALHPQTAGWAEGYDTPNEIIGIHNRMLQMIGTVSAKGPSPDVPTPELKLMMKSWLNIDPDTYTGRAKDVYLEVRRRKRAIQEQTYLPYRNMNDEQLSDLYHYTLFPNFILNIQPEMGTLFRIRPHATDPGRSYYDIFTVAYLPPGTPKPVYEHGRFRVDELKDFAAAFGDKMDPSAVQVQMQDVSNLMPIQQGCQSDSFKGGILGDQEIGVRHFHQVVDAFLSGERTA
jgi:phenylpropionate dioxygenase-like ring-hydroxylating dioxygenase large terminal subunit